MRLRTYIAKTMYWRKQSLKPSVTGLATRLRGRYTKAGLAGTDVVCPTIDPDFLDIDFSYFIRRGFLAAPRLAEEGRAPRHATVRPVYK